MHKKNWKKKYTYQFAQLEQLRTKRLVPTKQQNLEEKKVIGITTWVHADIDKMFSHHQQNFKSR
jgi:hypothetical protein